MKLSTASIWLCVQLSAFETSRAAKCRRLAGCVFALWRRKIMKDVFSEWSTINHDFLVSFLQNGNCIYGKRSPFKWITHWMWKELVAIEQLCSEALIKAYSSSLLELVAKPSQFFCCWESRLSHVTSYWFWVNNFPLFCFVFAGEKIPPWFSPFL